MSKKMFIVILLVLTLLTLNVSIAKDVDNSNNDILFSLDNDDADISQGVVKSSSLSETQIGIESNTTFDVIGSEFKVKLSDENNVSITDAKLTFTINGVNYSKNTDEYGIASVELWLNDGLYEITTKFSGNSIYQSSSKTTTVSMNNLKIVDGGLSNSEIQRIIDDAKDNNVILFKGKTYENVNLIINKTLTLMSNSNTLLTSSLSNPVIKIQGRNASLTTVSGFNIKGKGNGILISNAEYVTIVNNNISAIEIGIIAVNTNYLNVSENNIIDNGKCGIVVLSDNNTYIINNTISNNGEGIRVSKSNNTYIFSNLIKNNAANGIVVTNVVNGVDYNEGPQNLCIANNVVGNNGDTGINIVNAGENLKVVGNTISYNRFDGIAMSKVSSNVIQSNVIFRNGDVGIRFNYDYIKPKGQDISYNAIYFNRKELEAKDTFYQDYGEQLYVGENWYGDYGFVCPKINTKRINLLVNHIGGDYFQASFLDSNGNIAGLLPDRTLEYKTSDGNTVEVTISGGTGVFKVTGVDETTLKSSVDRSERITDYKDLPDPDLSRYSNGKTPTYSYPSIPKPSIGGMGGGDGNGQGSNGDASKGNGDSSAGSSEFTGNSTASQKTDPSNSANNPVNDVSQGSDVQSTTSPVSASTNGGVSSKEGSKSVVKQIIIDEEDIFKITGISFIILLILLTIAFYYRDDIKEMKSKI